MNKMLLSIALLFLGGAAHADPPQASNTSRLAAEHLAAEGVRLTVQFAKDQVEQFQPVVLIVTLSNNSSREMDFAQTVTPEHDFIFNLTASTGKAVPRTVFGEKMHHLYDGGFYSNTGMMLSGHQKATYRFTLSGLYDMTIPDVYTLTVEHEVPTRDRKHWTTLKSGVITLTVLPTTPEYVLPFYVANADSVLPHWTTPSHVSGAESTQTYRLMMSLGDKWNGDSAGLLKPTVALINSTKYKLAYAVDGSPYVSFKVEYKGDLANAKWEMLKSNVQVSGTAPKFSVLSQLMPGERDEDQYNIVGFPMSKKGFYRITALAMLPKVAEVNPPIGLPHTVREFDLKIYSNPIIFRRTASGFVAVAATGKQATSP